MRRKMVSTNFWVRTSVTKPTHQASRGRSPLDIAWFASVQSLHSQRFGKVLGFQIFLSLSSTTPSAWRADQDPHLRGAILRQSRTPCLHTLTNTTTPILVTTVATGTVICIPMPRILTDMATWAMTTMRKRRLSTCRKWCVGWCLEIRDTYAWC